MKGASLIDADALGLSLLSDAGTRARLVSAFGSGILSHGRVDRKKLAAAAFSDSVKLRTLNSISHPQLARLIRKRIAKGIARGAESRSSIIDAALYRELGLDRICDAVILLRVSEATAKKRLPRGIFMRRGFQKEPKRADFIIYNNLSIARLKQKAKIVARRLMELEGKGSKRR
jgi:dephospho-CoA kinase